MTVAELIAKLQTLDQSALVCVDGDSYDDWVEVNPIVVTGRYSKEDGNYGWYYTDDEIARWETEGGAVTHGVVAILLKSSLVG